MQNNILFAILCVQISYSQQSDPQKEVQRLVALGKDHIITLALEELKQESKPRIKASDFHYTKVFTNQQKIVINFGYNVIYLPPNSNFYTEITVELPSRSISMSSTSNGGEESSFYQITPTNLKAIASILYNESAIKDILQKGVESPLVTTIYEKEDHYLVDRSSRDPYKGGGFSKEEIHKETREVLSTLSGHYEPVPEIVNDTLESELFIEIKN